MVGLHLWSYREVAPIMAVRRRVNCKNCTVEMYWPSCYQGQAVGGAVLVDSFYNLYDPRRASVEYVNDLLTYLWLSTGRVIIAVCASGAGFGMNGVSITFFDLLRFLPRGLEVLLTVGMGNDYYRAGRAYATEEINELVDRYAASVRGYAIRNAVVIGGSCDVWGFDRWMDRIDQDLYERHRDMFIERFGYHGYHTYTGAEQLRGVSPIDSIGQLHVSSWQIVFKAYSMWLVGSRAKL